MGEATEYTMHIDVGERHSDRCAFQNNVSVEGMSQHVLDLRRVMDSSTDEEEPEEVGQEIVLQQSQRERDRSAWMKDYVEGGSSKD